MTGPPYDVITFDCYGTLIDWNHGIAGAFVKEAAKSGVELSRADVLHAYHEIEPSLQAKPYRLYRDVLAEAAVAVCNRLSLQLGNDGGQFLPDSIGSWPPFEDTNDALAALSAKGARLGILSNVDDDFIVQTLKHFSVDFDFAVTAQQVKSYKPAAPHFDEGRRRVGEGRWLHVAESWFHDVVPATENGVPVVWINRLGKRPGDRGSPLMEFPDLKSLVSWMDRSV